MSDGHEREWSAQDSRKEDLCGLVDPFDGPAERSDAGVEEAPVFCELVRVGQTLKVGESLRRARRVVLLGPGPRQWKAVFVDAALQEDTHEVENQLSSFRVAR